MDSAQPVDAGSQGAQNMRHHCVRDYSEEGRIAAMKKYEVHFGFELPFWLAVPEGECMVALKANVAKLSVTNVADRLEAGDPYLLNGGIIRRLSPQEVGEQSREEMKSLYPNLPVTRHPLKTLVTHVREVTRANDAELLLLYRDNKDIWYKDSLQVVNKLIDAYQLAVENDALRGHASRVAPWDVDRFVTSLWDIDTEPRRQLTGYIEAALPLVDRPSPISSSATSIMRQLLEDPNDLPIPQVLNAGALSKIARGDFRGAIIDDVTALEIVVENSFDGLARGKLPREVFEFLRARRFQERCRKWLPVVGGPKLTEEEWKKIEKARSIRHKVVHLGKPASQQQASAVHDACTAGLRWLGKIP